ncbi:uncharacterized protein isoform X3 [Rhodnius prolixus]|uniref:uncharacterized protein isoform X3 n=1 Tax=Rhodnius prolixus TaxID=13249 RepID=UPI003D18A0C5
MNNFVKLDLSDVMVDMVKLERSVRPVTDMATELKEERYWGYPIMDKTDGSTVEADASCSRGTTMGECERNEHYIKVNNYCENSTNRTDLVNVLTQTSDQILQCPLRSRKSSKSGGTSHRDSNYSGAMIDELAKFISDWTVPFRSN